MTGGSVGRRSLAVARRRRSCAAPSGRREGNACSTAPTGSAASQSVDICVICWNREISDLVMILRNYYIVTLFHYFEFIANCISNAFRKIIENLVNDFQVNFL